MDRIKQLNVFYHERKVGTLALHKERLAAFEYDREWVENGFSISPFSLPLEKKVFIPRIDPFEGLFGVFVDSLPDGWGRFLVDRLMLRNRIEPSTVGNLNRLAPAYDLTYSNSLNGEHATTINGNGLNPVCMICYKERAVVWAVLSALTTALISGDGGIRTLVPRRANAFRVRPVMTTSIHLHMNKIITFFLFLVKYQRMG